MNLVRLGWALVASGNVSIVKSVLSQPFMWCSVIYYIWSFMICPLLLSHKATWITNFSLSVGRAFCLQLLVFLGAGCHWPLLHFGAGSLSFFPGVAATMGLAYFVSKKLILGKEQVRAGVDYPAQGVMWSCPCLGRELWYLLIS